MSPEAERREGTIRRGLVLGTVVVVLAAVSWFVLRDRQPIDGAGSERARATSTASDPDTESREPLRDLEAFSPPRSTQDDDATESDSVRERTEGLRGRVVDGLDGSPIDDAEVVVLDRESGASGSATTRADGTFFFRRLPSGSLEIGATRAGYAPWTGRVREQDRFAAQLPVIELVPAARVRGLVLDADERPAVAAAVRLVDVALARDLAGDAAAMQEEVATSPRTGRDGRFDLEAEQFDFCIVVVPTAGESWISEPVAATPGEVIERTIRLGAGVVVEGVVQNQDGSPVPGAALRATDRSRPGRSAEALADESGHFRITGLLPGAHEVLVIHPDDWERGGVPTSHALEIPDGVHHVQWNVRLDDAASVTVIGRIVEANERTPVAGALVSGITIESSGSQRATPVRVTDDDGRFTLRLPPGRVRLTVHHERGGASGRTRSFENRIPATDEPFPWTIEWPDGSIEGALVDSSGAALAGQALVLVSDVAESSGDAPPVELRGMTDAAGMFRFDDVAPGRYALLHDPGGVSRSVLVPAFEAGATPTDLGTIQMVEPRVHGFVHVVADGVRRAELWAVLEGEPRYRLARWFGSPVEIRADIEPAELRIAIRADGYATEFVEAIDVTGTRRDAPFEVVLVTGSRPTAADRSPE